MHWKTFALTILLHLADSALTAHALQRGFIELNPVARQAIEFFGFAGLLILPAAAMAVQIAVLLQWPMSPQARTIGWALMCGLPAIPVVNNLIVLSS